MYSAEDHRWMGEALRLAEKGLCTTTPNPRVGCVLVKDGKLLGSGWHRKAGEPHAEVHALNEAGESARNATAYVTLEPCSHFGRTHPCADALIKAGVARVVVAMEDPNPRVAGSGIARLRGTGVIVECGLMEDAATKLNAGFVSRMRRGMPRVLSKMGMSLDGRTALSNGESKWITGPDARLDVQRWRARSCAVMTGINTILADDARLDVRDIECERQPLRVVLDSNLRMPVNARILEGSVLVYSAISDEKKIASLAEKGAAVIVLPDGSGRVDPRAVLRDLAERGCNEVLVEAGSVLNGALLRENLVDELLLYVSPCLLGDMARGIAALGELSSLSQRITLKWKDVRQVGNDLRITMEVQHV
jgi:diaminohydroxyphosphoribosylaminopyrimidine deaminase / 5-amino-6-(5-phosphoribosylamino)uracil reductase